MKFEKTETDKNIMLVSESPEDISFLGKITSKLTRSDTTLNTIGLLTLPVIELVRLAAESKND